MEKKNVLLISIIVIAVIVAIGLGIYKSFESGNNIADVDKLTGKDGESVDKSLVQENVVINSEGVKENISTDVISPIEIDEFVLKNISLKYEDEITKFSATVVNNSSVDYNGGVMFNVYFYDENGDLMISIPAYTSSILANGGESYINSSLTMDYTNATSIKVELNK